MAQVTKARARAAKPEKCFSVVRFGGFFRCVRFWRPPPLHRLKNPPGTKAEAA